MTCSLPAQSARLHQPGGDSRRLLHQLQRPALRPTAAHLSRHRQRAGDRGIDRLQSLICGAWSPARSPASQRRLRRRHLSATEFCSWKLQRYWAKACPCSCPIATTHRPATDLGFCCTSIPSGCTRPSSASARRSCSIRRRARRAARRRWCWTSIPSAWCGARVRRRSAGPICQRPALCGLVVPVGGAGPGVADRHERRTSANARNWRRPPIPLEAVVTPLPARGGEQLVRELFEPLGWAVTSKPIEGVGSQAGTVRAT